MAVSDQTVVISFAGVPNRPSMEELEEWFDQKCGLEEDKYMCVQLNNLEPQVSIVFVSVVDAKEFAHRNHKQRFIQNGKGYPTAFWIDQDCVTLRIHDLPSQQNLGPVQKYMAGFGALKYIFRKRWKNHWKGKYKGVIVVRMALTKHIPSYVTIGGHRSLCTYEGQACRRLPLVGAETPMSPNSDV